MWQRFRLKILGSYYSLFFCVTSMSSGQIALVYACIIAVFCIVFRYIPFAFIKLPIGF